MVTPFVSVKLYGTKPYSSMQADEYIKFSYGLPDPHTKGSGTLRIYDADTDALLKTIKATGGTDGVASIEAGAPGDYPNPAYPTAPGVDEYGRYRVELTRDGKVLAETTYTGHKGVRDSEPSSDGTGSTGGLSNGGNSGSGDTSTNTDTDAETAGGLLLAALAVAAYLSKR